LPLHRRYNPPPTVTSPSPPQSDNLPSDNLKIRSANLDLP
jgi:hypothetical protein